MIKRNQITGVAQVLLLGLVVCGFGWGGAEAWAGSLNDIRKEVRKKKKKDEVEEQEEERSPPPRRPHVHRTHRHHGHHSYHHGCPYCSEHHGDFSLAMRVFFSPFWGPWAAVEEGVIKSPAYPDYPYQRGSGGYIVDDPSGAQNAFSVTLEGGQAPYGYQQSVDARLTFARRFEFELVTKRMAEPLSWAYEDQLFLLQSHFNVPFALGKHAVFKAGVGVNTLVDPRSHPISGINFHYDMDFFPVRPLVISLRFGAGTVGEAVLTQSRATVGVTLLNAEVFAGYDGQWLGEQRLGGPVGGVRFWF